MSRRTAYPHRSRTRPDRIDSTPIVFALGMDFGVAIDLAGRCLQDLAFQPLGKAQHIDRPVHRGLGRLHRIMLVVHRRGRASEVVDLVDLDVEREAHVMTHKLETRMVVKVVDIAFGAGEKIVDAENFVPFREQPVDQMRSQETGATRNQNPLALIVTAPHALPPVTITSGSRHCPQRQATTNSTGRYRGGSQRAPIPVDNDPPDGVIAETRGARIAPAGRRCGDQGAPAFTWNPNCPVAAFLKSLTYRSGITATASMASALSTGQNRTAVPRDEVLFEELLDRPKCRTARSWFLFWSP